MKRLGIGQVLISILFIITVSIGFCFADEIKSTSSKSDFIIVKPSVADEGWEMRRQEAQSRRNEAEWRCKQRHPSHITIASEERVTQNVYMPMEPQQGIRIELQQGESGQPQSQIPVFKGERRGSTGRHRDYPIPSSPSGARDVRTGEYYPPAAGGVIDPKTGTFYQDVGGGYVNSRTGEFMPKTGGK